MGVSVIRTSQTKSYPGPEYLHPTQRAEAAHGAPPALLQQLSCAFSWLAARHLCGPERKAGVRREPWSQFSQPGDLGGIIYPLSVSVTPSETWDNTLIFKRFCKDEAHIVIESTFGLLLPDSQTTLPRAAALLPQVPAWTHSAGVQLLLGARLGDGRIAFQPVSAFPAVLVGCGRADFVGTWPVCHLTLMCHSCSCAYSLLLVLSNC